MKTKMSATQIAQEMLNRYGFFVVCHPDPHPCGVVREPVFSQIETIPGPFVIVGPASVEDHRKQFELAGLDFYDTDQYKYRAVVE